MIIVRFRFIDSIAFLSFYIGCSRGFILCVLYRALYTVSINFNQGMSITYPFHESDVNTWLAFAKEDCTDEDFQDSLGGTHIDVQNPSTFWNQPKQFYTWWKNNIERKKKFELLQNDILYNGSDSKLVARYLSLLLQMLSILIHDNSTFNNNTYIYRALFCQSTVTLARNIKAYFERNITKTGVINSINIPIQMPFQMPTPVFPILLSNRPRYKHRKTPVVRMSTDTAQSSSSSSSDSIAGLPSSSSRFLAQGDCMNEENLQQYSEIDFLLANTIVGLKQPAGSHHYVLDTHSPAKIPRIQNMDYGSGK